MTDQASDALATLILLGIVAMIGRELVQEKPMRTHTRTTRTCDVSELTLPHYPFDGFECYLMLHCGYQQTHYLSQQGHDAEQPQMTSAIVVYARLVDQYRNTHEASALELQQLQAALDADRAAQGRLQEMLEREVA